MAGLNTGLGVAGGIVATNLATSAAVKFLPVPVALQSGAGKMALKIGVGAFALPMLLRAMRQGSLARNVAIGAWAAVVVDAYNLYLAPTLAGSLGLSAYEVGSLNGYEMGELSGYTGGGLEVASEGAGAYTSGAYGTGGM